MPTTTITEVIVQGQTFTAGSKFIVPDDMGLYEIITLLQDDVGVLVGLQRDKELPYIITFADFEANVVNGAMMPNPTPAYKAGDQLTHTSVTGTITVLAASPRPNTAGHYEYFIEIRDTPTNSLTFTTVDQLYLNDAVIVIF